jgi:spore coat polysaccharide biosynthesis protein SpsF
MKTTIIVQARMTSSRLPGKVLKTVLGKSLLEIELERLMGSKLADQIVVATTKNQDDQPIVDLCNKLNVAYFRGSEDDVLSRFYFAVKEFKADQIVRITADCPVIDPRVVDNVITYYKSNYPRYDFVANCIERTYPRGMDTEIFSCAALEKAFFEATKQPDREHVTPFIRTNSKYFKLANIRYYKDFSSHRWTVDTKEDFELLKLIIENLYPKNSLFSLEDCLELLEKHPEWQNINAHIEQKKYGE